MAARTITILKVYMNSADAPRLTLEIELPAL
jgi:hypothetical protein